MKQHRDYHYTGYMIYKKAKEYIPLQTAMFLGMFAVTQIDSLVVSRLLGVQVLAALNTYSCIQLLTTALISMIETGVTVVYATAIGQNDSEQLNAVKCASMVLLLGLSGVLAVIQLPLAYAATVPLGLTAETRQLFLMYTVSMFFQVILNGWVIIWSAQIRAIGRMKLAALVSVLSGVLNVAFDYLFISAFDMGIRGAGYSSTVSALVCFAVLLVFMRKKTDLLRIRFCRCGGIIKEIMKCGSSSMLSLLVTMVFNYALIWGVNRALGDAGLAAKAVCAFVYRLALCFSKPLASLVAQFTGVYYIADNKKGVYMLSQRLTYMCLMVTGVICIYLWLAPQSVFRLFGYTAITASDVAVLRLFTVSILFDLPLSVLKNYFMGTKQVGFLNFLEISGAVLKAAALLVTVYLIGGVSV
ncbi:MAG: polysaccharide biosynthesis C-terminal domain-containing protein, partial [Oscillospiraceae bacterium]|nr:polysaccharide biosynthesis C-terminal domain-containing protein [Oscillospiraceae bacterium]